MNVNQFLKMSLLLFTLRDLAISIWRLHRMFGTINVPLGEFEALFLISASPSITKDHKSTHMGISIRNTSERCRVGGVLPRLLNARDRNVNVTNLKPYLIELSGTGASDIRAKKT